MDQCIAAGGQRKVDYTVLYSGSYVRKVSDQMVIVSFMMAHVVSRKTTSVTITAKSMTFSAHSPMTEIYLCETLVCSQGPFQGMAHEFHILTVSCWYAGNELFLERTVTAETMQQVLYCSTVLKCIIVLYSLQKMSASLQLFQMKQNY